MSENRKVPKLRFPEFEYSKWETTTLNVACEMNPRTEKLPNRFIYIDLESVSGGRLLKEDKLDLKDAPSRAQRLLSKEDVIFQTVRPYQKNNLIFTKSGDYVASTGYAQLRPSGDPHFLYQQIHTDRFVNEVLKRCTGTSYPAISSSDLGEVPFSLPSLPEQQKIAEFLTAVDRRIELLQAKKEKLETYKKGVMQKIFGQKIRFKANDGSDFPDWEERKLGEVYEFRTTNSLSRDKLNYDSGEFRNIHYGDIHTKFPTLLDLAKVELPFVNEDVEIRKTFSDNLVEDGDLLMADASEDYADIGKTIEVVNVNGQKVLAGLHTLHARRKQNTVEVGFGGYLMKSEELRAQIMKIAQGTKVLSISVPRMRELDLTLPCSEEQKKIVQFLTGLDTSIENIYQQINQKQTWKKGLLQKMFV